MGVPSESLNQATRNDDSQHTKVNEETESFEDGDYQKLRKAQRKVDIKLLLWYSFVYLVMRIHVSNITNTAIINLEDGTGIKKQLGNLSSGQWAWVLSIF